MLKRIKEIQGIGTYVDCKAGPAEFGRWSLIYGSNSYGKSTLCDVLRSLAEKDAGLIKARKTIPSGIPPKVNFSFSTANTEVAVNFSDDTWKTALPGQLRIAVFDSNFISRNLFTGVEVDRKNKEALTDFVLGEQGVKQAEQIAEMKKTHGQKKSDLKAIEKTFTGIQNIPAFIATVVDEPEDQISAQYAVLFRTLTDKKQQLENADKIVARPELKPLRFVPGAHALAQQICQTAGTSLQTIHDEVRKKLEHHIAAHVADPSLGREWIRTGVTLIKGDHCPFCGQISEAPATALYDVFQMSFDETYKTKLQEAEALYKDALTKYQKYEGVEAAHVATLEFNATCLDTYPEIIAQEEMQALAAGLRSTAVDIGEVNQKLSHILAAEGAQLVSTVDQKRAAPHIAIPARDLVHLKEIEDRLVEKVTQYAALVQQANEQIAKLKSSVKSPSMAQEISALDVRVRQESLKLKRKQLDQACQAHKQTSSESVLLQNSIDEAQLKLQQEQSVFLATFFEKINYFFQRFGSRDFEIFTKNEMDAKGHLPVISLNVRYKSKPVPLTQLGQVFSESDRRALALSVFWARLSVGDPVAKANTIIVLDDPVTSFDEDRISTTMMEIETEAPAYCQLIFLTHYRKFVHQFLQNTSAGSQATLLVLSRSVASGTVIRVQDKETFLHTDHHKKYLKILGYIQGKHESPIDADLRVFLESEVHERYRHAIHSNDFTGKPFKELITSLQEGGYLPNPVATRLDQLRKTLNEPHHQWSDRTPEDWATLASETVDFVYSSL